MRKTVIRITTSLFFVCFVAAAAIAQTPPDPTTDPCFPPPCIPIDGGVSLLIAAAIGIGGKKAYDFSKEN